MKPIVLISLLLCAAAFGSPLSTNAVNGHVRLIWSYTNTEPVSANFSFNIYGRTNLSDPSEPWQVVTNVLATDAWDANAPASSNMHVDLNLTPAQYFFVADETNFWGEGSITSNMCSTPPPPQVINPTLKIQKLH